MIEKIVFANISAAPKQIQYFDYWDVAWWFPRLGILSGYELSTVKTVFDPARAAIKAVSTSLAGNLALPNALGDPSPKTSFDSFLSDSIDAFDTIKRCSSDKEPGSHPRRLQQAAWPTASSRGSPLSRS